MGVARLLLPLAPDYQDEIRRFASEATGFDVRFGQPQRQLAAARSGSPLLRRPHCHPEGPAPGARCRGAQCRRESLAAPRRAPSAARPHRRQWRQRQGRASAVRPMAGQRRAARRTAAPAARISLCRAWICSSEHRVAAARRLAPGAPRRAAHRAAGPGSRAASSIGFDAELDGAGRTWARASKSRGTLPASLLRCRPGPRHPRPDVAEPTGLGRAGHRCRSRRGALAADPGE